MTAAIDIRARVFCSLGTVISGSLSDTYAQNAGLIFTRGSVEINGVIRPAVGSTVQFAYLKNGLLTRLPRSVVVLSSFADPFRGNTSVQLGCRLTYLENRKPIPEEETANSKEENGDVPCSVFEKATLSISASFIAGKIIAALGLSGALPPLTNTFSEEEFDLSSGYVSVLGNLLVSESYIGYMNAGGNFAYKSLLSLPSTGPVLDGRSIIDIGPIGIGSLPGDSVLVRYSSKRLKAPDDDEDEEETAKRSWEWEETFGAIQDVSVSYYPDDDPEAIKVTVRAGYQPYTFSATTYDKWDRAVQSVTFERSVLAETNNRYAVDIVKYGSTKYPSNNALALLAETSKARFTYFDYKVPPEGGSSSVDLFSIVSTNFSAPTFAVKAALSGITEEDENTALECLEEQGIDPDDLSVVLRERTIAYITEAELAGVLNLDTYTYNPFAPLADGQRAIDLTTELANILESVTSISYEKDEASGITKTKTLQSLIYGKTTTGQQDLATQLQEVQDNEDPDDLPEWIRPLLNKAQVLRNNGVETRIRTEREYGLQKRPSQTDRNTSYNSKEDPTEQVSEFAWATGTASTNFVEFSMPYAPDDRISWSEAGGYTSTPSDAKNKALNYGRVQNRLLLGNRNGVSIQIPADLMPPYPLDPLYLNALGLTGAYLLNGTTFTFDANGLIGSADCLFWGATA